MRFGNVGMDEFLKSLPLALQYVVLGFVGLGLAGRLLQNIVKGWNESERPKAATGKGRIVTVSTATLADMRPMEEAAQNLAVAAETLGCLSERFAGLLPLVPLLKDVAENLGRVLEIIERQDRDARDRKIFEEGRRAGLHEREED